jgi:hypothetical protein
MHILLKSTFAALALSTGALAAQAQPTPAAAAASTATPRVDAREARQQARIAQGAASGALTTHEQRRLSREQNVIGRAETRAKSDGSVTLAERHRLDKAQDRVNRDIRRQKHDRQAPAPQ